MGVNSTQEKVTDLVIIGGGPAGLAAVTAGVQAGLHVALIAPDLGGKVAYRFELIDRPPSDTVWGAELVHEFERYVEANLHDHYKTTVNSVSKLPDGRFQIELKGDTAPVVARTVLVATGAKPQLAHVPGEHELWMRGVSYSALSHAPFFHERNALVVGRGERALVATLQLATLANHVYLAPTVAFKPSPLLEQIRQEPKITLFEGWTLQRIIGSSYVEKAELVHGYTTQMLDIDGIFIELGLIPNQEFVRGLVEFDAETGRILVNHRCETSLPGLFAAGDVTNIFAEQVPVAIGEGTKAALSAWEYLATHCGSQTEMQRVIHTGRRLLERGG